jgi:predicted Zn-ribbon and HTH transcriptional regulator
MACCGECGWTGEDEEAVNGECPRCFSQGVDLRVDAPSPQAERGGR